MTLQQEYDIESFATEADKALLLAEAAAAHAEKSASEDNARIGLEACRMYFLCRAEGMSEPSYGVDRHVTHVRANLATFAGR